MGQAEFYKKLNAGRNRTMSKVKIKFIRRPLIQRHGAGPVTVSMEDAVKYIKNGDAIAITEFEGPPIHKMVTRPAMKKGGQSTDINPTLEEKEKINSPIQDGKPKVIIRLKK